ncbi:MAG: DEAD/DEAH box helicase [Burkholderiaceae bacterium]
MTTAFAALGLAPALVETLTALGYEEPTPIQSQALPALMEGRDVLGQAATGTGKTGAFALPLLQRHVLGKPAGAPVVLVLAPTRELAIQVCEAFHSYGKSSGAVVAPIYGGQEYGRQIRLLQRGVHVVVATPGRALDHIRRGTMDLSNIQAIVLDEADEMLDMGFSDDIDAIIDALPPQHQTALFSATLPPRISAMADKRLTNPLRILIPRERTAEGQAPRVRQTAYVVGRAHREAALGRILDVESPQLAIVFARTRNEVDELAEHLRGRGYSVEPLHGGLDQAQRDRVMKRARASQVDVIVATDVAARGIDIDHLTHVINYGIPASLETYVHRIGRTGRAGREGVAITLMEPREHRLLRNIEGLTKAKIEVRSVPTATDVRARRLDMTRAALREAILAGELDRFRVVIETLAEEFDPMDVAAAAIKLAHEATSGGADDDVEIPSATSFDRPRRDAKPRGEWQPRSGGERSEFKPREGAPRRGRDEGMVRIFIGAGREAGVRPADLVGAIANEAGIAARKIGAIEIADRFSLVEVDGPVANVVIDALRGTTIKGRQITVRRDQPKRAAGPGPRE